MRVDKKTYAVSEINRYKNTTPKTQIVIGFSLRKDNHHIIRLQNKEHGETKRWNTFTITRNGKVYQHYDDKYHSDYLGVKEGDKKSISIVLENMGNLYLNENNDYINWLNEICDEEDVIEYEYFGAFDYWERFPDEQIKSLLVLCKRLCKKHNIPKSFVEFNSYHKDISKYRGIVFRSNHIEDSTDTNPIIDIDYLNNLIG